MNNRYIWHETIQTQHTRRSFQSEVAPDVISAVRGWLTRQEFALPIPGYTCRIIDRSAHCLDAEVYTPSSVRLVRIGVAAHARCGASLWKRLSGAPNAKPAEPWCGVWLDPQGIVTDPAAYDWLGDFERCLAWAWIREIEDDKS